MNLEALANLGEAIGGLAVLVTLVYLAIQVKQNTDLAQGASQRDLMNAFQSNLDRVARSPGLWQRGLAEFESLSNAEQLGFMLMINPFINQLEQTLRMHARGLEAEDNIQIYGDICLAIIQEPGGLRVWEHTKPLYFPLSRSYIERRLEDPSTLPARASETMPWTLPDSPAE
ncbi:MAG: hypothetical protein JRF61_17390 [Deltaproteobacteria bacterium]|jgi:hypothetical protein|nr:hypothetical protein [Deltaproteobacteria bacterium]